MRSVGSLAISFALSLSGCGSCGSSDALRVSGPTPYVRCLSLEVPERSWQIANRTFRVEERRLTLPVEERLAVFVGPAPFSLSESALESVRAAEPGWVVVLGGIGDTRPQAHDTLTKLVSLEIPVLLIAGGRDDATVWDETLAEFDDSPFLIDARGLRRVDMGPHRIALLSGAPQGRYGRTNSACGFSVDDLSELADEIEAAPLLVSWAAPAESPVSRGWGDVDAGDPGVRQLMTDIGAQAGLYAWPAESRTHSVEMPERLVARIDGPPQLGADGSRTATGPTILTLIEGKFRVLSAPEDPP